MEPITAARIPDGFRLELTFEHAEELHDLVEYLEERLIGRMPALITALQSALWSAEDRPITLLPVTDPDRLLEQDAGAETDSSDRELTDAEEAALEQHIAWGESAAGQAFVDAEERFAAYADAQRDRQQAAYTRWLDEQAETFHAARLRWQRDMREQLRGEFSQLEDD